MEKILIVDDDPNIREFLLHGLMEYDVKPTSSIGEALKEIEKSTYDIVLLDMKLPDGDGVEFIPRLKNYLNGTPIIVMTAYGSLDNAIKAIRLGAQDFIKKPFDIEEIELKIKKVLEEIKLKEENKRLKSLLHEEYKFSNIVGKHPRMKEVFQMIKLTAKSRATVLIEGESGTGKELVARAIHFNSDRKDAPFVSINCAAIPETLLESELFGHEKGAFTGAIVQRKGKFELADKGTILLDEISEMSQSLQAKLLRVLQEFEFYRVGGSIPVKVDVRVIATTNRDLRKLVEEGKFREDLYYRLNVIRIKLPPLRERKEDIPLLVDHFIEKYTKMYGKPKKKLHDSALRKLMSYNYPGNVRELENIIERAIILNSTDEIREEHIVIEEEKGNMDIVSKLVGHSLEEVERELILKTLEHTRGNQKKAAEILGVTDRTLRNKLALYREMGINVTNFAKKE